MATEYLLRSRGRADPFASQVALVGLARELEATQQATVHVQLDVADLRDRLDAHEARHSWLPVLVAVIFLVVVVFEFHPLGG